MVFIAHFIISIRNNLKIMRFLIRFNNYIIKHEYKLFILVSRSFTIPFS